MTQTNTIQEPNTMQELIDSVGNSLIPIKQGNIIEVKILSKSRNKVLVDVGGFTLGFIPEKEFSTDMRELKEGDIVLAYILMEENKDGYVVLSLRRADKERFLKNLKDKYSSQESLTIKVKQANKGGLMVEFGSIEGFLPVSQLASQHYPRVGNDKEKILAKLTSLVGKNLTVKVISCDDSGNKVVFSEKAAGDDMLEEKTKNLKVGQEFDGVVSGIVEFGLFVDVGELEGLVHISEVSWNKVEHLAKMYKVGDRVKVVVISIENNKVSLSIKRLIPDPWLTLINDYKVGTITKGKITRITPFGVFVQISDKLNGLVHISELISQLKEKHTNRIEDILKMDKDYKFKITSVEPDNHKIALVLVTDIKESTNKKITKKVTKKTTKISTKSPKIKKK